MTTSATFVKQNVFAFIVQLLGFVSNLVFNIALPIFLGAAVFGKLSLTLGIAYFVVGIFDAGFNSACMTIISKYNSKNEMGKLVYSFYKLLKFKMTISILSAIIVLLASEFIATSYGLTLAAVQMSALLIIFFSGSTFLYSFFTAINKNESSLKVTFMSSILLISLPIIAYFMGFRLAGITSAVVITFAIVFTALLFLSRNLIKTMNVKPEPVKSRELLSNILAFTTTSFSGIFLNWGILLVLGLFVASEKVAFFKISLSWVLAIIGLIPISSSVVLSSLSGMNDKKILDLYVSKILKYGFIITIPAMFGIFLLGPKLIRGIYGTGYAEAGSVLTILCWAILPFFLNNVLLSILSASGNLRKIAYVYLSTTFLGVFIAFMLSSIYGVSGASLALVLLSYFITIVSYYFTREKLSIETKLAIKPLVASLLMCAFVFICLPFAYDLINGFLIIMAAILIYFVMLYSIGGFGKDDIRKINLLR